MFGVGHGPVGSLGDGSTPASGRWCWPEALGVAGEAMLYRGEASETVVIASPTPAGWSQIAQAGLSCGVLSADGDPVPIGARSQAVEAGENRILARGPPSEESFELRFVQSKLPALAGLGADLG